jgi:hypothetical protein
LNYFGVFKIFAVFEIFTVFEILKIYAIFKIFKIFKIFGKLDYFSGFEIFRWRQRAPLPPGRFAHPPRGRGRRGPSVKAPALPGKRPKAESAPAGNCQGRRGAKKFSAFSFIMKVFFKGIF